MKARELKGRHVLIAIVAFFGVIFAVNGVMTYVALSTFSGIETEDAYRYGREYNATLEAAEAQARLGWTVAIDPRFAGPDRTQGGAHDAVVHVTVTDSAGTPLSGLGGTVTFWRPVVQGKDVTAPVVEEYAGKYRAAAELPAAGRWELRLALTSATGVPYYLEKRVFVPAPADPPATGAANG